MIIKPKFREITVRSEGDRVLLLLDGALVCSMSYKAADNLARAVTIKAREAEEIAKVEQIIADNAIMMRTGAPFGFSNDKRVVKESINKALYDSKLRRYLPRFGGIKSKAVFGKLALVMHPPKKGD